MNNSLLELNDFSLANINGGDIKDLSYQIGKGVGWFLHERHDKHVESADQIMRNHTTIRR
ncbi:hypothetical protein [Clostridium botulinum]|uniref:hypothetical protein n=1 Tax=Clostridium botulinum TaxID=1491 RepID=UPI0007743037|nr:hypothetical protein [Clostridium botulinum]MBY6951548.1 hypothetical protein [Clostridium botulinum]MCR1139130.1 hypothetical protein [Clostridium botulinum]NEZ78335.1 hypothetical protein [Clostridium botulinum]NFA15959.1 hypothetical protein [Clostridium botulinum]NFA51591.1 hypothetical protein [Clostridium botulinum]